MKKTSCFSPAHILLPSEQIKLEQWGCVACDQFTSDRSYWEKAEWAAAGSPSALNLILPEVYLEDEDVPRKIETIHAAMDEYTQSVLTRAVDGFIYVERTEQSGRVRQGLVGKIDLEAYSYAEGAKADIRPSEHTVESRIPPRMAVRRGASLETPHIMMLADDPDCTLIELIGEKKAQLRKVYEGELMLGGGHIAGWAVEDPALLAQIDAALQQLGSQEAFDAKYPEAKGAAPLTLAVGDGNHSLASAKACWEELKPTLTPVEIEPIHRVLFNVDCGAVLLALIAWSDSNNAGICFGDAKQQSFTLAGPHIANVLSFERPIAPMTVGTIDTFIEYFMARHIEARVDYVHDEPAVRALCRQGGVAFLMPPFEKSDLFKGIVMGGVLPRKTFSMGHAEEKRYYMECRNILGEE